MERANDTRWSSHFGALMSITLMFSISIIGMVEVIEEERANFEQTMKQTTCYS